MAFNIAEAFADLSPKGPIRTMITEIELHLIDKNPANFYSMDGIEELADNIRMFGLMEPLIVKPTEHGRYMLISGHRRRAALCRLADEGFFPDCMHHKVDCILHEGPVNLPGIEGLERMEAAVKIYEQLKILYANADTRVLSSADKAMQVRRIRELLTQLKNLGYKLPGRMRDLIADAAKVSASRVARLEVIEKGLTDQRLRAAWKSGDLSETNAYEVARYTPEVQRHMTDMQVQHVCRSTSEEVQAFMPSVEADYEVMRRLPPEEDAEAEAPKKLSTVDNFSDVQFDGKGKMVWDADAYMEQRRKEDEKFFELLCQKKDEFLCELGAVNSRQEGIERLKKIFRNRGGNSYDVDSRGSGKGLELRKRICDKPILRTWTDVYDMLCTIALNDAAVRLEEEERPKPEKVSTVDNFSGWKTGTPETPGDYVIVYGVSKEEKEATRAEMISRWDGELWISPRTGTQWMNGMTVYRWVKLPEV